jgi:hypothetical protein
MTAEWKTNSARTLQAVRRGALRAPAWHDSAVTDSRYRCALPEMSLQGGRYIRPSSFGEEGRLAFGGPMIRFSTGLVLGGVPAVGA